MRRFRFIVTTRNAESGEAWRAKARRIESLGYDTITTPDHLTAQFAPMPGLMAAADATTTLRVSALVFANDYRNPVMFAKEIATIDAISGGRCDVGIGTGWYAKDYEMMGIPLDPPGVRVARLDEALVLMKRLWTEEKVDHQGRFYRTVGAAVLPRVHQKPYPPIVIGAGGPVMLRLAARHADIVSITGALGRTEADDSWRAQRSRAAFEEKLAIIRKEAGTRFAEVGINYDADIKITDDPRAAYEAAATKEGVTPEAIAESPAYLYGSLAEIHRAMLERRDRYGLCYYRAPEADIEALAPLAKLVLAPS
jgi:probable F420-dependent oxidoreductase